MIAIVKAMLRRVRITQTVRCMHNLYKFGLLVVTIQAAAKGILNYGPRHRFTIAFYPDTVQCHFEMHRIMLLKRYRRAKPNERPDIRLFRATSAHSRPVIASIQSLNGECTNTSKIHIDRVHRRVFGYNLQIDPLTFVGAAFVKSDEDGTQDGSTVQLPVNCPARGAIYQRIVDNIMPDGTRQDICIPIVAGRIPFVHTRYRRLEARIGPPMEGKGEFRATNEIISNSEQAAIMLMCREMKFEFGELDAIRDNRDGRIYIIDFNLNTGGGVWPKEMRTKTEYWHYLESFADAFDHAYVEPLMEGV